MKAPTRTMRFTDAELSKLIHILEDEAWQLGWNAKKSKNADVKAMFESSAKEADRLAKRFRRAAGRLA